MIAHQSSLRTALAEYVFFAFTFATMLFPVLLDVSVIIHLGRLKEPPPEEAEPTVSSLTVAEFHAGVATAADDRERALRMERLDRVLAEIAVLPFDGLAARAYGDAVASLRPASPRTWRRWALLNKSPWRGVRRPVR